MNRAVVKQKYCYGESEMNEPDVILKMCTWYPKEQEYEVPFTHTGWIISDIDVERELPFPENEEIRTSWAQFFEEKLELLIFERTDSKLYVAIPKGIPQKTRKRWLGQLQKGVKELWFQKSSHS